MVRLTRVDCSAPGLTRRRRGRGFEYLDTRTGERIADTDVLDRIRALAIPPAYTDVWISPHPRGHLQATGTDAAGRRQYRYHPDWRKRKDAEKFDEMLDFARALPDLRETCTEALQGTDRLTRERVLAAAIRLLDHGFFRIGTEEYTEQHDTFGLATMRKDHVTIDGATVVFDYLAKGSKRRIVSLVDADVVAVVTALKRRRSGGDELLAYKEGGRWRDVRSPDINAFLKEQTGGDHSAKDFRTWSATLLAAVALGVSGEVADTQTGRKRAIARAVKEVSHYLGNTPAVCRASYIDPRVIDAYQGGVIVGPEAIVAEDRPDALPIHQKAVEAAVLRLLDGHETGSGLERVAA